MGTRPLVVCLRAATADPLAALNLGCDVVQWVPGDDPPPGHRADICLGGNLVDESALEWAVGARWVHLSGVGSDNVPPALLDNRIVTNSPGVNAVPVAEFALAAMLAAVKRLPETWESDAMTTWADVRLDTLEGRTVGIIGLGHVGRAVAERARAFGMTVLASVRTPVAGERGVEVVSLGELAARSDHIVVAASAGPHTRHIVGAQVLAATRRGVHLVNVSRGSLVDLEALKPFLDSGHVSRASLDTVEPEPLPHGHWLRSHPRVRYSPHVASVSPDSTKKVLVVFAENFRRFSAGEPLLNVIRG